ncbi:Cytidine deaminase [Aphelenchoides besseyi]|nr:Cytidine deaminase [Aphelenchoides besseyi]KAI6201657.1 Cytidine deaminase [Aphelenchoides besseyi]
MNKQETDLIVEKALSAFRHSYCPYSNFPVASAVLTQDGHVFVGVNVENASYGGTICAERSAIVSAVSNGHRNFKGIVVITKLPGGGAPCGLCRQFLVEFGDMEIFFATPDGQIKKKTTCFELLPMHFGPQSLAEHRENSTNLSSI